MKIHKTINIDTDLMKNLEKEENASSLIEELLTDFYSRARGLNTDLIKARDEVSQKIEELKTTQTKETDRIKQKEIELEIFKLESTQSVINEKIIKIELEKKIKDEKKALLEEHEKSKQAKARECFKKLMTGKLSEEDADKLRTEMYSNLTESKNHVESIIDIGV